MKIIRLPEGATGVTQGELDPVSVLDQIIKILRFPGKGLLQQPEEILGARPFVLIPKLNVVPPACGGILDYQAEISVFQSVFVHDSAPHILLPEYIQYRHFAGDGRWASI